MTRTALPAETVLRFGDCEIHLQAREVWRAGQRQQVRRQVFDLMVMLIQAGPRTVSHRDIGRSIWRRAELPRSLLARAVMEARRATGDDPQTPSHFLSVRGVGYRFAAELHPAPAPAPAPVTSPAAAPAKPAPVTPLGPKSTEDLAKALVLLQRAYTFLARVQAAVGERPGPH